MADESRQHGAKRRGGGRAGARAGSGNAGHGGADAPGPGHGGAADAGHAAFSLRPEDALAFMQNLWNPFGMAVPGFGTPAATPGAAAAAPPAPAGTAPSAGMGAAHPFGLPMPFPNAGAMFAALDPEEVERRIADLRVVEGWLRMTLGMMEMSIRTLELQKASLEAMRGAASRGEPAR